MSELTALIADLRLELAAHQHEADHHFKASWNDEIRQVDHVAVRLQRWHEGYATAISQTLIRLEAIATAEKAKEAA
jgi:hypothetical protein